METAVQIFENIGIIVGASLGLFGLAAILWKKPKKYFRNCVKNIIIAESDGTHKEINKKLDNLSESIGGIISSIKILKEANDMNLKVHQSTIRNRITNSYDKYCKIGSLPPYERKNILSQYNDYKLIGGNGFIDELVEELLKLPAGECK